MHRKEKAIVVRCDAGRDVGMGHLNRCLGLSEAFADDGWKVVLMGHYDSFAASLVAASGFQVVSPAAETGSSEDAAETEACVRDAAAQVLVFDSYRINAPFLARFTGVPVKTVLFDDFSAWPKYPVDHVLNFAIDATSNAYPPGTPADLMGPRFFPARRHMRTARRVTPRVARREISRISIVISSDPGATMAQEVLACLKGSRRAFHVRVLLGAAPGAAPVEEMVCSVFGAESAVRIGATDISGDLQWADAVVCSGGLVKYEAGYLGVPSLVISRAGREARDTAAWTERGAAIDLGVAEALRREPLFSALTLALQKPAATLAALGLAAQDNFPEDGALQAAKHISDDLESAHE